MAQPVRIGIDLGGTKIEGVALQASGAELARLRIPTPREDYDGTLAAIGSVVAQLEAEVGVDALGGQLAPVGVGMPGTVMPGTGLVKNANSTWLNGRQFEQDLNRALGRPVRCANDANCLAVSEATDGAARGAAVVFAVILGTGCGGGLAVHSHVHIGPNAVGGEWGHNPLPWPNADELPGPLCYCGKHGCLETWISGTGLGQDHRRVTGQALSGPEIVAAAQAGNADAGASLQRLEDRIGRALASLINQIDPDVIVIGGGLSRLERIYTNVRPVIEQYLFGGGTLQTFILPAMHGDASGVRGAAWLWPA